MQLLDWLADDPAPFNWPPDRNRQLEAQATAIATAAIDVPLEVAARLAGAVEVPWTFVRGLHVPAAAIAPARAIPIDAGAVAALVATSEPLDWWQVIENQTVRDLARLRAAA